MPEPHSLLSLRSPDGAPTGQPYQISEGKRACDAEVEVSPWCTEHDRKGQGQLQDIQHNSIKINQYLFNDYT